MAKISNTIKVKKDDGTFENIQISYIQPKYCTAEGLSTTVEGVCAHAEGKGTIAFNYAHAEGEGTIASGTWAHAEGAYTQATKKASHAEGGGTTASGEYSHAEGSKSKALKRASHAEGEETTASGDYSHAEGRETMASGEGSHAEGGGPHYGLIDCFISGAGEKDPYEGYKYTITFDTLDQTTDVDAIDDVFKQSLLGATITTAEGGIGIIQSLPISADFFMVGMDRPLGSGALNAAPGVIYRGGALGHYSHAEGYKTTSSGDNSHTEGNRTVASSYSSHAEGGRTIASGDCSHAEGGETIASGHYSHTEGCSTTASGESSHAEGYKTQASAAYAHAEGNDTTASGEGSHAEGGGTTALEGYSHAEGVQTTASGYASHAEGYSDHQASTLIDLDSVSVENETVITDAWKTHKFTLAFGLASHAEGYNTLALGSYPAHAEGIETIASGAYSHAEGNSTEAKGAASHAGGEGTIAAWHCQTAIGQYNSTNQSSKYAFIIGKGKGSATADRSNAFTVAWDGKGSFASTVGTNGADYAEYFEWEDKNPLKEDRIGYLVFLNKNKIQKAQCNDNILGIISGTAGVLGDNYEWEWKNKYLTDNFGRILYEEKEQFIDIPIFDKEGNKTIEKKSLGIKKVPKLNPEYNPDEEYISRAGRPEWDIVGLMGKLYLRDDGTCIPGEYAKVGTEPGIATYSETETKLYVMERITDNIIRVFLK